MDSDDERADFLDFGQDLVEQSTLKASGTSSIHFDGLINPPLQLHEDLAGGCGGQLWPAGMVLAKYMLTKHNQTLDGKTIIELGAGGGLVGLAVALGCAPSFQKPLFITDQQSMTALMERNIVLNQLSLSVNAAIYNWGESPPLSVPNNPDIILAADCVYFEPAFPLLQKTLLDLIGEKTVCYFCFKKRRRADLHFVKAIRKVFDVKEVQNHPDREIYSRENIFLYEIRKQQ